MEHVDHRKMRRSRSTLSRQITLRVDSELYGLFHELQYEPRFVQTPNASRTAIRAALGQVKAGADVAEDNRGDLPLDRNITLSVPPDLYRMFHDLQEGSARNKIPSVCRRAIREELKRLLAESDAALGARECVEECAG